jgi:hypothetical protein
VLWVRAVYARWAMQYVPVMIDGRFNDDYQRLSDWMTDERLVRYLEGRH